MGKTWLALKVLHSVAKLERFGAILWFSARDIDLLDEGPKRVTPRVLSIPDIACEFVKLIDPRESREKGFKPIDYVSECLSSVTLGWPILYVFDNFETLRNPFDVFSWIDANIRPPNKVLITTRVREFKGDYPIEIGGMNLRESETLLRATAASLGIRGIITPKYEEELIREADGHPYVLKIMLGEVAKERKIAKLKRVMASKEDILEALFERTYAALSRSAKRVFLTASAWHSNIPFIALEAVMLRHKEDRMDVQAAVDELWRSSFLEMECLPGDDQSVLTVPLVAALFGRRKLRVSPMKLAVEADLPLLRAFGARDRGAADRTLERRVSSLFKSIAKSIASGEKRLDDHIEMLEFLSRRYPPAWKLLAQLYTETNQPDGIEKSIEALRHYLETQRDATELERTWYRIATLSQLSRDTNGEIQALVEVAQLNGVAFESISNSVNRLNQIFHHHYQEVNTDEKRFLATRLSEVMENRIGEGDATARSRLAWLFLHVDNTEKARMHAEAGLRLDPDNDHCLKLVQRLHDASLQ